VVADDFDVVAVSIEHVSRVVARVVPRAFAGRAVAAVGGAGRDLMKALDVGVVV
jgi:Na+/alanine symporter